MSGCEAIVFGVILFVCTLGIIFGIRRAMRSHPDASYRIIAVKEPSASNPMFFSYMYEIEQIFHSEVGEFYSTPTKHVLRNRFKTLQEAQAALLAELNTEEDVLYYDKNGFFSFAKRYNRD